YLVFFFFFFFQAEDGIRDFHVTGVQTCALPISILTKTELLLILIGGVFVLEMLSVIIQVTSFKLRKKRVFKMSPIHHHFELSGWSEWKVVTVFWSVGLLLAIIGLMFIL